MPQLTFDKEHSPMSVLVRLEWNQLADEFTWSVTCLNQECSVTNSASGKVAEDTGSMVLAFALAGAFEDWLDMTPGYTVAQLEKRMRTLCPEELPAGMVPLRVRHQDRRALMDALDATRRGPKSRR